jgi:hypothetical protein
MPALDSIVRLLALGASADVVTAFGTITQGNKFAGAEISLQAESVSGGAAAAASCYCDSLPQCQITGPGSLVTQTGATAPALAESVKFCWDFCFSDTAFLPDGCEESKTPYINLLCAPTSMSLHPDTFQVPFRQVLTDTYAPNPVKDEEICAAAVSNDLNACVPEHDAGNGLFDGPASSPTFSFSMLAADSIQFFGDDCNVAMNQAIAKLEEHYPNDYRLALDDTADGRPEATTKAGVCELLYKYEPFARPRKVTYCVFNPEEPDAPCQYAAEINKVLLPDPDDTTDTGADANGCQELLCYSYSTNPVCWQTILSNGMRSGQVADNACPGGASPWDNNEPCVGPCTARGSCYQAF